MLEFFKISNKTDVGREGDTVDYFEQFCAISNFSLVLVKDNTN